MIIRKYNPADETGWLRCRAAAYLDTGCYDDVRTEKEEYLQPDMCLVAEEDGAIIGIIDAETDSYDLSLQEENVRGAMIWQLAVLPEYRRSGVARALWQAMKAQLAAEGVTYFEAWTHEDVPANGFFRSMGFELRPENTWLRCRASAAGIERMLSPAAADMIFGVESLIFNAPAARREELMPLCESIDEVRLYSLRL